MEQEEIANQILEFMKKEGRDIIKIEHAGERWLLEILSIDERIRVAKDSKTPVSESTEELDLK